MYINNLLNHWKSNISLASLPTKKKKRKKKPWKKWKKKTFTKKRFTEAGGWLPDSRAGRATSAQPLPQQSAGQTATPPATPPPYLGLVMHAKNFCQTWNLNIYRQCRWQQRQVRRSSWERERGRQRVRERDRRTTQMPPFVLYPLPAAVVELKCAELTQLAKGMIYFILFARFLWHIIANGYHLCDVLWQGTDLCPGPTQSSILVSDNIHNVNNYRIHLSLALIKAKSNYFDFLIYGWQPKQSQKLNQYINKIFSAMK